MVMFTSSFKLQYKAAKKKLKGEDLVFVDEEIEVKSTKWCLYCICDGHGGTAAAQFISCGGSCRVVLLLSFTAKVEGRRWSQSVAKTMTAAFCSLDEEFAKTATPSGTTLTAVLVCGSLLTVANVGDSEAFLDTCRQVIPLTKCHKVETNEAERERLNNNGATISAYPSTVSSSNGKNGSPVVVVGPLRVWPGGIAISRSIGDFDCSPEVIAKPHITQVVLPAGGSRLILASDGLWDRVTGKKACSFARNLSLRKVPARLSKAVLSANRNHLVDDTTILVLDIIHVTSSHTDFSALWKASRIKEKSLWVKLRKILLKRLRPDIADGVYSSLDSVIAFPEINSKGNEIYHAASSPSLYEIRPKSVFKKDILYHEATHRWISDRELECIQAAQIMSQEA